MFFQEFSLPRAPPQRPHTPWWLRIGKSSSFELSAVLEPHRKPPLRANCTISSTRVSAHHFEMAMDRGVRYVRPALSL